ncbi:hypothetical protein ACROYT_G034881 [Oculina patagonica]
MMTCWPSTQFVPNECPAAGTKASNHLIIQLKCLIMAEEQVTEELEEPRLSKNSKLLGFFFAFICIGGSMAIFAVVVFLRKDCPDCKQRSPIVMPMLVILATLLFFLGIIPCNHVVYGRPFVIEASSLDLPDYFTAVQNTGEVSSSVDAEFCTDVPEIRPPSYEQAVGLDGNIMRQKNSLNPTAQDAVSSIPAEDVENSPVPILPDNHVAEGRPMIVIEASSLDLPDYFTAVQNTGEVSSFVDSGPPSYEQAVELDDNTLQ